VKKLLSGLKAMFSCMKQHPISALIVVVALALLVVPFVVVGANKLLAAVDKDGKLPRLKAIEPKATV